MAVESDLQLKGSRQADLAGDDCDLEQAGRAKQCSSHDQLTMETGVVHKTTRTCKRPAATLDDLPVPGLERVPQATYRLMPYTKKESMAIRRVGGKQFVEVKVRGATMDQNTEIAASALAELQKGKTEEDVLYLVNLMKTSFLNRLSAAK